MGGTYYLNEPIFKETSEEMTTPDCSMGDDTGGNAFAGTTTSNNNVIIIEPGAPSDTAATSPTPADTCAALNDNHCEAATVSVQQTPGIGTVNAAAANVEKSVGRVKVN